MQYLYKIARLYTCLKVGRCLQDHLDVVIEESEAGIALPTNQPSDLTCSMIVIDAEILGPLVSRLIGSADSTTTTLSLEPAVILLNSDSVVPSQFSVTLSLRVFTSIFFCCLQLLLTVFKSVW
jgi:hypothetical protein